MASLWFGHFDSTPTDERDLTAEDWATFIRSLVTDGVRDGGANLQVSPAGGLAVNVDNGEAIIQGYIISLTTDYNGRFYTLPLAAPHPQFPRVDRVVLRLDRGEARTLKPVVLMGTAAASPAPPALTRSQTGWWEMSLAQIHVAANATAIAPSDITDERFDTNLCGILNSALGLDPSAWQAQFDSFLAAVKSAYNTSLSDFAAQLAADSAAAASQMQAAVSANQSAWDGWFTGVVQDTTGVYFAFDNWAAIPGVTKSTDFSNPNNITETIINTATGANIATRSTVTSGGTKTVTETLHKSDGSVFRSRTAAITFGPAGVTEIIV